MVSALLLWHTILPKAAQWWIEFGENTPTSQGIINSTTLRDHGLPGGYNSLEEMNNRSLRFPGVSQRVLIYMSDWYNHKCGDKDTVSPSVKYTYVYDDSGDLPPLLLLQEKPTIQPSGVTQPRDETPTAVARTFVLDSAIVDKGARIFYLRADEIRRCDDPSCKDATQFIFPSLHSIDMSSSLRGGYIGNALDPYDGNRNGVVPIILQFGDMEVSRAFVPRAHRNETYPVIPIFKKFRKSMSMKGIEMSAARTQCIGPDASNEPPMNPSKHPLWSPANPLSHLLSQLYPS